MSRFLVVFDRARGTLLEISRILDGASLSLARLDAEDSHRENSDAEVVILSAASESDLRHTHARYFEDFASLAMFGRGGQVTT